MRRLAVLFVAATATALPGISHSQTSIPGTPQEVQLLAPQLITFAGSQANFNALVTGLTQGLPITIATTDAAGLTQIVTFSPPATALTPVDAARVLENARSSLIARGVSAPTAQQIAVSLVGGTLTTASGTTSITGVAPGLTGTQVIQVRNEFTGSAATASVANANSIQALRTSLAQSGLTQFEANQALQIAGIILAQNGIITPTAEQLQTALVGGTLLLPSGQAVPVAGVLQGRLPAAGIPTAGTTITGTPTPGTTIGFPTAGSTSTTPQIPTPTAPTAGTPQFGNAPTPASNAAASAGSSGGQQGIRRTR